MNQDRPQSAAERRHEGTLAGLRWEVERCPDATLPDAAAPAAVGGLAGFLLSGLLQASGRGRLLAAALGVAAGAFASRYHVNLDWDPDRLRGDDPPGSPPGARDDPDVRLRSR